ncbi:hypothetical protein Taro_052641 [Colocasia esculenta]|uniref:Uncharacterized protein n=1 Tax=Colocasia esculenta TaxID=4460 RepID=A0A843XJ49_COLES|nr:hypothetical protein [Colocasia esculenta]
MSPVSPRLASSLLLLLLAAALAAGSSSAMPGSAADAVGLLNFAAADGAGLGRTCTGLVGDCIDEEEEMMMESEISRRGLRGRGKGRYVSYQSLSRGQVPCNRRGQSYYNCQRGRRANPYKRGCSYITRCGRILN